MAHMSFYFDSQDELSRVEVEVKPVFKCVDVHTLHRNTKEERWQEEFTKYPLLDFKKVMDNIPQNLVLSGVEQDTNYFEEEEKFGWQSSYGW